MPSIKKPKITSANELIINNSSYKICRAILLGLIKLARPKSTKLKILKL